MTDPRWFAAQSRKVHTSRDCHHLTNAVEVYETTEEDAAEDMKQKGRVSPGRLGPFLCRACSRRDVEVPEL